MKKILKLVTCCMLSVLMLVGCGEKTPTAEELVAAQFGNISNCQDITMSMVFDVSSSFEDMSMDIGMSMDAILKSDEDTVFLDGMVKVNALGINSEEEIKQYSQKNGSEVTTYEYQSDNELWVYNTEEVDTSIVDKFKSIDTSIFEELALSEGNEDDTAYIVQGYVKFDKLMESMGDTFGDLSDSDVDFSKAKMSVIMSFDKKTKFMTDIDMAIIPESIESTEEMTIKNLSFCFKFNEISDDFVVEIPNDVLENSISFD